MAESAGEKGSVGSGGVGHALVFAAWKRPHAGPQCGASASGRQPKVVTKTIDIKMAQALRHKQDDVDLAVDAGQVNAARLLGITTKAWVFDLMGESCQFRKLDRISVHGRPTET
jgi:hypothetical protein